MAQLASTSPTFDPQLLYEDWDDEEDRRWKNHIQALIHGTQTTLQTAQNIDNYIRSAANERLQNLIEYADSHNMTADDRASGEWGGLPAPNAGAHAEEMFRALCRLLTVFEPYSESQDRVFAFLEELRSFPRWMAPEGRPDEAGVVSRTEFWTFGRGWIGLTDEFRRQHAAITPFRPSKYSYTEPTSLQTWRNFQHAMARITANSFVYCAPFSALQDLAPPSPPKTKARFTNAHDVTAAAQWLIWPTECRYVYEECMNKETTVHFWEPWSKEAWSQWKEEFVRVTQNIRYEQGTRRVAMEALRRMSDVEEEAGDEGSIGTGRESD